MTIVEFLLARIAEDEELWSLARDARLGFTAGNTVPAVLPQSLAGRMLADCEAKRRIVELHRSWPVLVEREPTFEQVGGMDSLTFRASQQLAWMTDREYRAKFGSEPPTAPMLAALAEVYADHPDYDEAWRTR